MQAVVALPGDGRARRWPAARATGAGPRSRPRARRRTRRTGAAPRCRPAGARAGPARRRGDRAGARGRRRRGRRRAGRRPRGARPRPGRPGAGRRAARARPGTRPPSAARSPTTARASTATSTPASSSGSSAGPKAPHSSTTPRASAARSWRAKRSSTSPWMRTRSSLAGALGGLDQQLRALVRVGGAEEGDGQALAAATGAPVAPEALPDLVGGGDGLLDDVDHVGRVVLAGEGRSASRRRRRGTPRRRA